MWGNDEPNIDRSNTVIDLEGLRGDEVTSPFTSSSDTDATEETGLLEPVAPVETVATDPSQPVLSEAFATLDSIQRIFDLPAGDDTFVFGGAEKDFAIVEALDYAHAYADASRLLADDHTDYVAVQLGDDVLLFADVGDTDAIGSAVVLVGRSLTDLGLGPVG